MEKAADKVLLMKPHINTDVSTTITMPKRNDLLSSLHHCARLCIVQAKMLYCDDLIIHYLLLTDKRPLNERLDSIKTPMIGE